MGDPDRFFHLALARETVAAGKLWLTKIPQIVGLGWDRHFPDKEFLFHLVNRGLYSVGGDAAVLKIIPVASGAIVLSLVALLMRLSGAWTAGALVVLGLVLDPYLLTRLGMMRPHLLAILWFVLMLHALLSRSAPMLFLAGTLYSWSYHSFYVPMLVLMAFVVSEQLSAVNLRSPRIRMVAWGCLGLATGLIVNPAFPGNLIMGFRHLVIALFEASTHKLDFGMELFPWSTERFARLYLPFLVLVISTPFIQQRRDGDFLWIWVSTLGFFALAAQNPRAIEYAVPLGLMLFALTSKAFSQNRKRTAWFFAALALSSVPRATQTAAVMSERAGPNQRVEPLLEALGALEKPAPGESAMFYNVEWDVSPYIYYALPGYEFNDLLDPSFLEMHDKRHHSVRWQLRQGEVPDPWGVVQSLARKGVRPRHLLTRYPGLISQLKVDPHFKQLYPDPARGRLVDSGFDDRIYEISHKRDPHFVSFYDVSLVQRASPSEDAEGLGPESPAVEGGRLERVAFEHVHAERTELGFEGDPVPSSYLDLRYGAVALALGLPSGKRAGADGVSCAVVRPAAEERRRQAGKNVIALGGGRGVRVWLNGRKLFRSVAARDSVDPMERLLLLDQPMREADRVEVLVCSKDSAPTFGVSLSFWSDREIGELCASKGWKPAEGLAFKQGWERISDYRETCFGSYIRRTPRLASGRG